MNVPQEMTCAILPAPREMRKAAALGVGFGLVLGSLAMWHNDPTTAGAGSFLGLCLCALSLTAERSHSDKPSR